MTDEQINQRIAEACGWKPHDHPKCMAKKEGWSMPERWIMRPDGTLAFRHDIPKYCTDLNAMHEAEKVLSPQQEKDYFANIKGIVGDNIWYRAVGKTYRATARERAEAFLRTLGKLEEVQQ